jgi:hypothetical protein
LINGSAPQAGNLNGCANNRPKNDVTQRLDFLVPQDIFPALMFSRTTSIMSMMMIMPGPSDGVAVGCWLGVRGE